MSVGPVVFPPPSHVMDATRREPDGAVGLSAGAVHRPQRPTLGPVGGADGRPTSSTSPSAQHHRHDLGLATHPRTVDTGNGTPSWVSQIDRRWSPVDQGVVVDQHGDLRSPITATATATADRCDHGVDFELGPGCAAVAVLLAQLRPGRVDRGPHGVVADRVEFEMGVTHPGLLVRPTLHGGPFALLLQFVGV